MKIKKIFIIALSAILASSTYASEKNSSLTLTFINNSNETLTYTRATEKNPENTFTVSPTVISPKAIATITATTTPAYDLAGNLHFQDHTGKDKNVLMIMDLRQYHTGQSVFNMQNKNFVSIIKSKTRNPDIDPHALSISAVTLEINRA